MTQTTWGHTRVPITEADERSLVIPRLSWGALFGGAFAALAIGATLYIFGLAIAFMIVNPDESGSLQFSGIFTAIWGIVSAIVALFIGGLVAGRGAGSHSKGNGGLHGLVLWGLTTIASAWLFANVVSSLLSGALAVGGSAVQGRSMLSIIYGGMEKVQVGAADAANMTANVLWGVFGTLIAGMIAAVVGGMIGAGMRRRHWTERREEAEPKVVHRREEPAPAR